MSATYGLGRNLFFAALGLAAGALLFRYGGASHRWLLLGAFAALIVASFVVRRRAPAIENPTTASGSGDGLPTIAREVLEGLPDPLLLVEPSGRVTFANTAMRALIGNARFSQIP